MSQQSIDPSACDRCDATIVSDPVPRTLQLALSPEPIDPDSPHPTYEKVHRELCRACEIELLAWIDGEAPDRSGQVDLPDGVTAVRSLEQTAESANAIAESLRESLDMEADSDE